MPSTSVTYLLTSDQSCTEEMNNSTIYNSLRDHSILDDRYLTSFMYSYVAYNVIWRDKFNSVDTDMTYPFTTKYMLKQFNDYQIYQDITTTNIKYRPLACFTLSLTAPIAEDETEKNITSSNNSLINPIFRIQDSHKISSDMTIRTETVTYDIKCTCQNKALPIAVCLLCSICVLLLAVFIYQNKLHIKCIRIFIIQRCRNYKRQIRTEKEFDVFICYSENESTWVHEQLLQRLHDIGISCCTHEKDFVPGVPILDNIFNFMSKSRRVLFVVTRPFIESKWGKMELEIARYHAIGKKKESEMVIIMKEHIPVCNMPDVLKNVWFNITCLQYPNPDDEAAAQKFWKRLLKVFMADGKRNGRQQNV